jgi:hypothetical protein
MENLNAENIIEILDKMDFFQGQRAGRELWNDKPFEVQEQDIANFSRYVNLLKNYIKELTRKLEIANLEIECKERICESYALQYGTVADKEVWLNKERADTVRKMQERLKAEAITIQDHTGKLGLVVLVDTIDQIANELLEGSDET